MQAERLQGRLLPSCPTPPALRAGQQGQGHQVCCLPECAAERRQWQQRQWQWRQWWRQQVEQQASPETPDTSGQESKYHLLSPSSTTGCTKGLPEAAPASAILLGPSRPHCPLPLLTAGPLRIDRRAKLPSARPGAVQAERAQHARHRQGCRDLAWAPADNSAPRQGCGKLPGLEEPPSLPANPAVAPTGPCSKVWLWQHTPAPAARGNDQHQ